MKPTSTIGQLVHIRKPKDGDFAFLDFKVRETKQKDTFYIYRWSEYSSTTLEQFWYKFEFIRTTAKPHPKIETLEFENLTESVIMEQSKRWSLLPKMCMTLCGIEKRQRYYDELMEGKVQLWETISDEKVSIATLKQWLEFGKYMDDVEQLNLALLKDIGSRCKNVASCLGCGRTGMPTDGYKPKLLTELQSNPYHLFYKRVNWRKEEKHKSIRTVKKDATELDKIFREHGFITKDDPRRVEYWIYDNIHHGSHPLKNRNSCFSKRDFIDSFGKLCRRRNLFHQQDDPEDINGEKNARFLEDPPSEKAISNFLDRVANHCELGNGCKNVIVSDRKYFYDSVMLAAEKRLAKQLADLLERKPDTTITAKDWDEYHRQHMSDVSLSPEQKEVIVKLCQQHFYIITGGAGTGKTTLMSHLVTFLEACGFTVYVASFMGTATVRSASVLQRRVDFLRSVDHQNLQCCKHLTNLLERSPRTLHKLYHELENNRKVDHEDRKILILDEAGTLSYGIVSQVIERLQPERVYLFGDEEQLTPILAQRLLLDMIELQQQYDFLARLTAVHRGEKNLLRFPVLTCGPQSALIQTERFILEMRSQGFDLQDPTKQNLLKYVCEKVRNFPLVITGKRDTVKELNRLIRPIWMDYQRTHIGLKEDCIKFTKDNSEAEKTSNYDKLSKTIYIGDRVMCLKNVYQATQLSDSTYDYDSEPSDEEMDEKQVNTWKKNLIFAHGEIGIVVNKSENGELLQVKRMRGDQCSTITNLSSKSFVPTYAMTVHKAQGSECDNVVVVLGEPNTKTPALFDKVNQMVSKRFTYTAFTRHRKSLLVLGTRDQLSQGLQVIQDGYHSLLSNRIVEERTEPVSKKLKTSS